MGLLDPWRETRASIIAGRPVYSPASYYAMGNVAAGLAGVPTPITAMGSVIGNIMEGEAADQYMSKMGYGPIADDPDGRNMYGDMNATETNWFQNFGDYDKSMSDIVQNQMEIDGLADYVSWHDPAFSDLVDDVHDNDEFDVEKTIENAYRAEHASPFAMHNNRSLSNENEELAATVAGQGGSFLDTLSDGIKGLTAGSPVGVAYEMLTNDGVPWEAKPAAAMVPAAMAAIPAGGLLGTIGGIFNSLGAYHDPGFDAGGKMRGSVAWNPSAGLLTFDDPNLPGRFAYQTDTGFARNNINAMQNIADQNPGTPVSMPDGRTITAGEALNQMYTGPQGIWGGVGIAGGGGAGGSESGSADSDLGFDVGDFTGMEGDYGYG